MQVFAATLNRCRLMQQLGRQQAPKGGLWAALGGRAVRQLEALAANPSKFAQQLGPGALEKQAGATASSSSSSSAEPATPGTASAVSTGITVSSCSRAAGSRSVAAAAAGSRSPGRRRAGNAASAAGSSAAAAHNTAASAAGPGAATAADAPAAIDGSGRYDEDGLR